MKYRKILAMTAASLLAASLATSSSVNAAPGDPDLSSLDPATAVSDDGTITSQETSQAAVDELGSPNFIPSVDPDPHADVTGVDYRSPDEHEPVGTVTELPDDFNTQSIIGDDDRERVSPATSHPASATVNITRNGNNYCTGWLVGADTVITAGHCMHPGGEDGDWYPRGEFQAWPGRDGADTPYGSCAFTSFHSVTGWTEEGDSAFDYGAGKLDCNVGDTTGTFGFRWQSDSLDGTTAHNRGYPGDKATGQQWMHSDQIRHSHDRQLFYHNDTVGGHSGGPIYDVTDSCGNCGIAVHAYGVWEGQPSPWGDHNYGPRITEAVFNNFVTWRDS